MGSTVSVPSACELQRLQALLKDARRAQLAGSWKEAQHSLLEIMKVVEPLIKRLEPTKAGRKNVAPRDSGKCTEILLEAGRLWNGLMRMDRAVLCFQLAGSLRCSFKHRRSCGSRQSPFQLQLPLRKKGGCAPDCPNYQREVNIQASWMQTILYASEIEKAEAFPGKLDIVLSPTVRHSNPDDHCRAEEMVLGLIQSQGHSNRTNKTGHAAAIDIPAEQLTRFGKSADFTDRCNEAKRLSLLSHARCKVTVPEDTVGSKAEMLSQTYHLWKQLDWPLDHAETIVDLLFHYAQERIENGHTGAESSIVETLLDLHHKVWRHCGQASLCVGVVMHDLAVAAEKRKNNENAKLYWEKALAVCQACREYLPHRDMFIGAAMCPLGMIHVNKDEMEQALGYLEECLRYLEQNIPKEGSRYYWFAMGCLGRACWGMATSLWRGCSDVERTILFSEKVLACKTFLDDSMISSTQRMLAVCLHCKATSMETQGQAEAAEALHTRADDIFTKRVECSLDSYDHAAYGYFLYHSRRFTKAAEMFQLGYRFAEAKTPYAIYFHALWPTLTEEIRFELNHSGEKRFHVPDQVMVLYFSVMTLSKSRRRQEDVADALMQLAKSVDVYDYALCSSVTNVQEEVLRYSSLSLLGYAYRELGKHRTAAWAFRKACEVHPSVAARLNMVKDTSEAQKPMMTLGDSVVTSATFTDL